MLRLASNSENTRMVVAAAFQKQKPMEEIVPLLQKEYYGGAGLKSERGEFSVWYAEDGIHLAKGRTARYSKTAQVISWEDAAILSLHGTEGNLLPAVRKNRKLFHSSGTGLSKRFPTGSVRRNFRRFPIRLCGEEAPCASI